MTNPVDICYTKIFGPIVAGTVYAFPAYLVTTPGGSSLTILMRDGSTVAFSNGFNSSEILAIEDMVGQSAGTAVLFGLS